jgi:tetratricopeptide (TPR) repeat protein
MARKATTRRARTSIPPKTPNAATASPRLLPSWPWIVLLFAGLAASLLAFAPALNGTFVFDDIYLPFANPDAAHQGPAFWIGGVRPVLMLTYWANFLISGTHTLSYHLVNIGFHAANALLVFLILERLFVISGAVISGTPFPRRGFALFGTAIFLLHPLQTESVAYIAGRSELVAGFFFLAAWLVFLRNFEKSSGVGLTLAVCLLTGLAVASKEAAVSLPAVLLLTDLCFPVRPLREQFRARWKLYSLLLIGATAAGIRILLRLTPGSTAGFSEGISPFSYALTECRVIFIYLRMFVLPYGQNGDWRLPFYRSFTDGAAIVWAIGLLLLLAFAFRIYRRDRLMAYGFGIFLLILAPTSSIVPIKDALAERRMYLPIIGLILVLLAAGSKLRLSSSSRRIIAFAAVAVFAVLSWNRSSVWASDFNFWRATVAADPDNSRAHLGLGTAFALRQQYGPAAVEFAAARKLNPSDTEALWNLARAWEAEKNYKEALPAYRSYAAAKPGSMVYDRIGFVEARLGHPDKALEALDQALKINGSDATAFVYRGVIFMALRNAEQAKADFHRALEIEPGNQIAKNGLAKLTR